MTEDEARRVVLLRAYERPPTPPWTHDDAQAAADEAARTLGEAQAADAARFAAARAEAGLQRLLPRAPAARRALALSKGHPAFGPLLVLLALALGAATPALGPDGRLNLLAPPLLGLLAWNLVVYALLLAGRLRPRRQDAGAGLLRRGWTALLQRRRRPAGAGDDALQRFAADWAGLSAPLWSARAAAWLHAAALALAAGVVAGLYLRGLAFEFRAGWASTFLGADAVHRLLGVVLGPASALSGIALPSADALDALRFGAGPGENAARWIHLHALTALLAIGLPRGVLALAAFWRAGRLARRFPLPLDGAAARRWLPRHVGGGAVSLSVQPYACTPADDAVRGLSRLVAHAFGPGSRARLLPRVAEGDETKLDPGAACLLFTLSATPERETHGVAAQAVPQAVLLVDESGFVRRFDAGRVAQRREAWRRMLAALQRQPVFVDLAAEAPDDDAAAALPVPHGAP